MHLALCQVSFWPGPWTVLGKMLLSGGHIRSMRARSVLLLAPARTPRDASGHRPGVIRPRTVQGEEQQEKVATARE